jgi:hypothetical protein
MNIDTDFGTGAKHLYSILSNSLTCQLIQLSIWLSNKISAGKHDLDGIE